MDYVCHSPGQIQYVMKTRAHPLTPPTHPRTQVIFKVDKKRKLHHQSATKIIYTVVRAYHWINKSPLLCKKKLMQARFSRDTDMLHHFFSTYNYHPLFSLSLSLVMHHYKSRIFPPYFCMNIIRFCIHCIYVFLTLVLQQRNS